ncbi:FG-GAP-like repeat-containing protein [Streptomyces sp. NPDC005805]|uniref:FG-GAP-like repeat-containing protein n=1 Tax=Streptomyces sp. NPDC005805 TaxID=3157068 RepID=UPI00340D9EB5
MESGRAAASSHRTRRRRVRVAACTALAVAAGMLLAAPTAQAATPAGPGPVVEPEAPEAKAPGLKLDRAPAAPRGEFSAQDAGAPLALPRSDVDGDGLSDLIFQDLDGSFYVSTGSDTYEYPFYSSTASSGEVHKDVFSASGMRNGGPAHFTLTAAGRLTAYDSYTDSAYGFYSGTGWQQFNKVFSPGDLTGDGVGDILARNHAGQLFLYRGAKNSSRPFTGDKQLIGGGWQQFDQLVGMNDVNNDGIADLFARTTAGDLYFYSGTGVASRPFKAKVKVGSGWNQYNSLVSIDDLDEDGNGDLFARTVSGDLYLLGSTGTGSFRPRVKLGSGWHTVNQFANAGNMASWGRDTVFALQPKGTLFYYWDLNNGKLSARQQIGAVGAWKGAKLTPVSSLDDTGRTTLLEVYNGALYNLSHKSGSLKKFSGSWSGYNLLTGPGDLTGDGKGDLLGRDKSGVLWVFPGNGSGTAFGSRVRVTGGWQQFNAVLGGGDTTGDGRADVLARGKDGRMYLYEGTGVAAKPFKAKREIGSTAWRQFDRLLVAGDLNGDGRADLLARTSNGALHRYDANGRGTWNAKVTIGSSGWTQYSGLY